MTRPKAQRLADKLESHGTQYGETVYHQAAIELRHVHAENKRLHQRHHDDNVEYTRVLAQRDALLEALRYWLPDETMTPAGHEAKWSEAVAAIKAVEGEKE